MLYLILLLSIPFVVYLIVYLVHKNQTEKYPALGAPGRDYDSAYLTGAVPGGAVYVNNPDDFPGLGWLP